MGKSEERSKCYLVVREVVERGRCRASACESVHVPICHAMTSAQWDGRREQMDMAESYN